MFSPNARTGYVVRLSLLALTLFTAMGLVRAERLPVRLYTTADGLWSSSINYLMRDSRGFIWLCTRDGISRFDGYGFVNYKINDDPAAEYVSYMFEDSKGVFWIALYYGGLYRFDPKQEEPLAGRTQTETIRDDGRVVIHAKLINHDPVRTMYEDRKGNFWVGANGLFLIKQEDGQTQYQPIALNLPEALKTDFVIFAIAEGQDGSLWLGTSQGLLRQMPDGRIQHFSIQPRLQFDKIPTLLIDRDQRVWIGAVERLYVLRPEPLESIPGGAQYLSRPLNAHKPGPANRQLLPEVAGEAVDVSDAEGLISLARIRGTWGLHQTANGQVWVGGGFTLAVFDGERFQPFTRAQGVVDNPLGPFAEDLDGDLWVGTISGPLRFSVQKIKSYDVNDGISEAAIEAIMEEPNGALDVVGENWFINRLEDRKFKAVRPNLPADATHSWTSNMALVDRAGDWWFLTNKDGLYRFAHVNRIEELAQRRPTARYTERDGLKSNFLYCMFEDARGDLWISTRDNSGAADHSADGLTRWDRATETFHIFNEQDGLPNAKSASSFAQDKSGNLWFGFYQGGLARYTSGHFATFSASDGLPDGPVVGLLIDRAGRLWIASATVGVLRVDDPTAEHPKFVNYSTKDGLSSNNARCLTEDSAGRIYIGTLRGVDRLIPETNKITHFSVTDGLAGDFIRSAYRDRKGALWFGTFNGLSRFDPQPDRPAVAPSISINSLRVAGVSQNLSAFGSATVAGLELGASQNDLQIDFFSLSIAHAALLRYQYKLEGTANEWSPPSEQRTVNYANLPSGTYRFLVRAVNADGVVSETPASVSFRILPPIWRRWWFVTMAALFVFGWAALAKRYRTSRTRERRKAADDLRRSREERLRELERVRKRIASDLHDDLGSSLTQISLLSEVLRQRVDQTDALVEQPLRMIASSSRDIVDAMSDIVWAINPEKDHLSDLSRRMRSLASEVFTTSHIDFTFREPGGEKDVALGANLRREVFLIFKESINNIIKHSGATAAQIEFQLDQNRLLLQVNDNGRGFDLNQNGEGHGLASMRARSEDIGAALELISGAGNGTTVTLRVPLRDGTLDSEA
jgi:signal transduction histidine kinase/ligand-binding sensor domain-containing protein